MQGIALLVVALALAFILAPIGIWTMLGRMDRHQQETARGLGEAMAKEIKLLEEAVKYLRYIANKS